MTDARRNLNKKILAFGCLPLAGIMLLIIIVAAVSTGDDRNADLDTHTRRACDDFVSQYDDAQTQQARTDLADQVTESATQSEHDRIHDAADALTTNADAPDQAWETAADTFVVACQDVGWDAE